MDVSEFYVPLFTPNILDLNLDIFSLWVKGYDEKDVIEYLFENVLYSKIKENKNEDTQKNMKQVLEQIKSGRIKKKKKQKFTQEEENEHNNELTQQMEGDILMTEEIKMANEKSDKICETEFDEEEWKTNENYIEEKEIYIEEDNDEKEYLSEVEKSPNLFNTDNKKEENSGILLFYYFLFLYIKHQFYIYHIVSYHLGSLDLRFTHLVASLNKNVIHKLIKIYYNIDIDLEKEIIKYKNINYITKCVHDLIVVTNIHEISVKRQIENIKNLWKYILNIYESKHINISKLHKKRKISFKKIIKYVKTNFQSYKHFIKRENVLEINDNVNKSFSFKNIKEKRNKKGINKKKRGFSNEPGTKVESDENNIIKILEKLIGVNLAKRYFRLYWIIVYHIETPKKIFISYPFFNKIILMLLEKLQINDLIMSKEYINMSKKIYSFYNSNKNMEMLKNDLFSITENDANLRNRRFQRVKNILNLLCCFRNFYKIKKFFLIFIEVYKNEPFENEHDFVKKHVGHSTLVIQMLNFLKDAESYAKKKGMTELVFYSTNTNV